MLLFHVQNGSYNSFFFTESGDKEIIYYESEEDYGANKGHTRTLEYDGPVYGDTYKYFIFINGHALKIDGLEIMLMPTNEKITGGIGEILKDGVDVTEYSGTSNKMLIPYTDRLSHSYEVYDSSGIKIQIYSSVQGFPFIGNDNPTIEVPTSGPLKDKKCIPLTWSNNTYVKNDNSFSSQFTPWAYLSSLKPLYIVIKPKKPQLESWIFNNFIFKYDEDNVYNRNYYMRWG